MAEGLLAYDEDTCKYIHQQQPAGRRVEENPYIAEVKQAYNSTGKDRMECISPLPKCTIVRYATVHYTT